MNELIMSTTGEKINQSISIAHTLYTTETAHSLWELNYCVTKPLYIHPVQLLQCCDPVDKRWRVVEWMQTSLLW